MHDDDCVKAPGTRGPGPCRRCAKHRHVISHTWAAVPGVRGAAHHVSNTWMMPCQARVAECHAQHRRTWGCLARHARCRAGSHAHQAPGARIAQPEHCFSKGRGRCSRLLRSGPARRSFCFLWHRLLAACPSGRGTPPLDDVSVPARCAPQRQPPARFESRQMHASLEISLRAAPNRAVLLVLL